MPKRRTDRLNSNLKEVISEVIQRDVRNPHLPKFVTVTSVDITSDLHYAKVYISVIGTPEDKKKAIDALQSAAGFIAATASKKVVMRYFPDLTFKLDEGVDKHMRIAEILSEIHEEQERRPPSPETSDDTPSE